MNSEENKARLRAMQKCRKQALRRLSKAYHDEFRAFLRDEYAKAGLSVRGYESAAEKRAKQIADLKARIAALESAAS
jgi:hypothetical protein